MLYQISVYYSGHHLYYIEAVSKDEARKLARDRYLEGEEDFDGAESIDSIDIDLENDDG